MPSSIATVAGYEDSLGGILEENFQLTPNSANLTRANDFYADAVEGFKKVDLPIRVAESYWKIARNLTESTPMISLRETLKMRSLPTRHLLREWVSSATSTLIMRLT